MFRVSVQIYGLKSGSVSGSTCQEAEGVSDFGLCGRQGLAMRNGE